MRELAVDFEEVGMAMETHDSETEFYLDLESGEVVMIPSEVQRLESFEEADLAKPKAVMHVPKTAAPISTLFSWDLAPPDSMKTIPPVIIPAPPSARQAHSTFEVEKDKM